MWSLGCILAELYTGHPLFPGDNEVDLLMRVIEVFGNPPHEMIKAATSKQLIFDSRGNLCVAPTDKGAHRRFPCSDRLFSF
jgi:dual specificity tyrosine-phosphorylation-regulated kinase 2/3/4